MKLFSLLAGVILMAPRLTHAQTIQVLDSAKRSPIPGATIVVIDPANGKMQMQGVTDAGGHFAAGPNQGAALYLAVTAIGYKKASAPLGPKDQTIILAPDNQQLKEVKIKGDKSAVTFNGNIMEYDISQVPHADYMSLPDIIDQLPFLRVEDKSIKMMDENLKILIDDRPNSIYKDAIALKSLPPQAIEKVEVVLTPTARNGGKTINITLKHDYFLGLNGSADVSGSRLSVYTSGAVSYWHKKYGIDATARYNYSNAGGSSHTVINYLDDQSTLNEDAKERSSSSSLSFSTSAYYNLDDYNTIDMQARITPLSKNNYSTNSGIITQSAMMLDNDFSNLNSHASSFGVSGSLNYTHKYHKKGNVFYLLSDFHTGHSRSEQLLITALIIKPI